MPPTAPRPAPRSPHPLQRWRRRRVWVAALLLLTASAVSANAQIVRGRVLDNVTESGLDAVLLTLLDELGEPRLTTMSDDRGRFHLLLRSAGRYGVRVERQGYRGFIAEAVIVGPEEEIAIELRMATDEIVIAPIAVLGRRRLGSTDEYGPRIRLMRQAGIGHTLTRTEIEGSDALDITDLLADVSGVVVDGPLRGRRILFTNDTTTCRPAVFVNADPIAEPSVDQVGTPLRLDAIEVYRGSAETPPEFHDPTGCGVVLVWMRPDPADARPLKWRRAIVYISMAAIGVVLFSR